MTREYPNMLRFTINRLRNIRLHTIYTKRGWEHMDTACNKLLGSQQDDTTNTIISIFIIFSVVSTVMVACLLIVAVFTPTNPSDALPNSTATTYLFITLAIITTLATMLIGSWTRAMIHINSLPRLGRCLIGVAMTTVSASTFIHANREWPNPLNNITIPVLMLFLFTELIYPHLVRKAIGYEQAHTPIGDKHTTEHERMEYLRHVPRSTMWWW